MTTVCAVERWDSDGLIEVRGLLSAVEVEHLRGSFDALRAAGAPMTRQVLYTHEAPAAARPTFDVLMDQWLNPHRRVDSGSTRAIIERVECRLTAMFGEALSPFQDVLLAKRAEHRPFPWHQDEPYWPVATPFGVVVWCALDPVDRANGGVEFAVGSHRLGLGPAIDLHTGEAQLGTSGCVPDLVAREHRCVVLGAGDAVLFQPRLWHRSGINRTGAPRRAWSSSWLPLTARGDPARAPRHPLAASIDPGRLMSDVSDPRGSL